MDNKRIQDLMNKAIDRIISEDEKVELDNYLKTDPELKINYVQLIKSAEILDKLPEYEASSNIKKNILNSIETTNNQAVKVSKEKIMHKKFSFTKRRTVIALAFGMVVCLFVFVLWNKFYNTSFNNESVSGYMGMSESLPFDTREIYSQELLGIESSFRIYRNKDTLYVSMDKKTAGEISIGYSFDPAGISFIGVREIISTSPSIKTQGGRASITLSEPSKIFALFQIIKPSTEMDIQVRDAERQVFRYKFNVDKKKIKL